MCIGLYRILTWVYLVVLLGARQGPVKEWYGGRVYWSDAKYPYVSLVPTRV